MRTMALMMAAAFLTTVVVSGTARAGDTDAGKKLFKSKCKMCHTNKEGGKSILAPNLFGVFGRKAGTLENFSKFSEGMKASGVVWDSASIDKLMQNPAGFSVGSKMKGGKIDDANERAAIIAYMETMK